MSIAKNGFTIGMSDMRKLGLTTYARNDGYSKKYGGYNFAFSLDERDYKYAGNKYGKEAIVFRASGLWYITQETRASSDILCNTAKNRTPIAGGIEEITLFETGKQIGLCMNLMK